jgi:hypothetical protein
MNPANNPRNPPIFAAIPILLSVAELVILRRLLFARQTSYHEAF